MNVIGASDLRPSASAVAPSGRAIASNTFLNLVGQLIPLLIGLAAIPAVIRGLGPDRFGILTLCWVVLGYLGIFQLGIGPAVTKFASEMLGRDENIGLGALLRVSVRISAVLGVLACVVLAALTPLLTARVFHFPPELEAESRTAFFLLAGSMPFLFVLGSLRGFLSAAQRFGALNSVWGAMTSLNYVIPLAAVILGRGLPSILFAILLSRVAAVVLLYVICRTIVRSTVETGVESRFALGPLLRYGGWVALSSATNPLLSHLERFLIASFLSVGVLTYYATPYEMISRVTVLPASLALTLFPAVSYHAVTNHESVRALFARSMRWLLLLMAPVTVLLAGLGDVLLSWWLGGDFPAKSTHVFRILALTFFFNAFAHVPLAMVQGLGRPDLKARLDLVEVPIFAGLLVLLLPRGGITGAAWAKLLITLVDMLVLFWFSRRLVAVSAGAILGPRTARLVVLVLSYGAVSAFVLTRAGAFPLVLLALIALTAVYAVLYHRVGMDERDREAVRSFAFRLRNRKVGP